MSDTEVWKPAIYLKIDGEVIDLSYHIEVSNLGETRFTERFMKSGRRRRETPRIIENKGYIYLKYGGGKYPQYRGAKLPVHRIVKSTFHPESWVEGYDVDHIDNNPSNNHLTNLQWLSREENRTKRAGFAKAYVLTPEGEQLSLATNSLVNIGKGLGFDPASFQTCLSGKGKYKGYRLIRNEDT